MLDTRAADQWWDSLPADRKHQLYRWITFGGGHAGPRAPMDGEQPLFPVAVFSDRAGAV
jgi:hypothetical protein